LTAWLNSSSSTSLERAGEEVLIEVEVAALDAAAGEDALGELVAGQAETVEDLGLREHGVRVRHGQPGDVGAGARAAPGRADGGPWPHREPAAAAIRFVAAVRTVIEQSGDSLVGDGVLPHCYRVLRTI
jgi:hypothetical protein